MTSFLILTIFCLLLAALCNAQMDRISDASNYLHSIPFKLGWNADWWSKERSWLNKYKNRDYKQGEDYLGSTTFWVWRTDGWHLLKAIFNRLWQLPLAILLWANYFNAHWWFYLDFVLVYVALGAIFGGFFSLFYRI